MHSVVQNQGEWHLLRDTIDAAEPMPRPTTALMCDPSGFRVEYVINPHMADASGDPLQVDTELAQVQWQGVHDAYKDLGIETTVVAADPRFPDQVFTANHGTAYLDNHGNKGFVPARMANPEREGEVPITVEHLTQLGYSIQPLMGEGNNEGGGDLLWLADRKVLLAGHGFRSDLSSVAETGAIMGVPVIPLQLVDERWYHLDTCLTVFDRNTALWVPQAFTPEARRLVRAIFDNLLEVPEEDATRLAANAHSPDGKHVLIESSCILTRRLLEVNGFDPVPVDTSEFGKSGGSVTCMRHMVW